MGYAVKEVFYSIQGEGANSGRPAVFCRFAGCNLWSGCEEDREAAICDFCDTDFVGVDGPGGRQFETAESLVHAVGQAWANGGMTSKPFVICTGGEPLLQLDDGLIAEFHAASFDVAIETNGTKVAPSGLEWICVSPKGGSDLLQRHGNELKLVFPQRTAEPECFDHLDFEHFFLQPMDGPARERNTTLALDDCLDHPKWRLSLQIQKLLHIR